MIAIKKLIAETAFLRKKSSVMTLTKTLYDDVQMIVSHFNQDLIVQVQRARFVLSRLVDEICKLVETVSSNHLKHVMTKTQVVEMVVLHLVQ